MELKVLKYGNLMGSPDMKKIMHDAGEETPEADELFDELYDIKIRIGQDGIASSVALIEQGCPEFFPALVDFSFLSADPASHNETSVRAALDSLASVDIQPESVKSVFITHQHGDHFDPRVLQHLPNATVFADPGSGMPGAQSFPADEMPDTIISINTPGHGGPHCSYIIDIEQLNLSACIAGDLIMSHAHFLSLDHPLSFSDPEAGKWSVNTVVRALMERKTKHRMILPGHDVSFFITE